MKICSALAIALLTILLTGCCGMQAQSSAPLPPPISLAQQLSNLPASFDIPRFRGIIGLRGVEITHLDDKGNTHVDNAEGILLIRKSPDETPGIATSQPDILLIGRAWDQEVFQAGRNATNWWIIFRMDKKTAWVGNATSGMYGKALRGYLGSVPIFENAPTLPNSDIGGTGLPRPDLVPMLLGLTRTLVRTSDELTSLEVNDATGTNDLRIFDTPDPRAHTMTLLRKVLIDRRTNLIRAVQIYNAAGIMIMGSVLSDYREAPYTGQGAPKTKGPLVPYNAVVTYPAQHITIALKFDKITIPQQISDETFSTPNFADQGLHVIRAD